MWFVRIDLDPKFADALERQTNAVMIWVPDEDGIEPGVRYSGWSRSSPGGFAPCRNSARSRSGGARRIGHPEPENRKSLLLNKR